MANYSHLKINVSNEFKNKVKNKLPLDKFPKFYSFLEYYIISKYLEKFQEL